MDLQGIWNLQDMWNPIKLSVWHKVLATTLSPVWGDFNLKPLWTLVAKHMLTLISEYQGHMSPSSVF